MLLIEGCAQTAVTAAAHAGGRNPGEVLLTGCRIEFTRFLECHLPVTLEASVRLAPRDHGGMALPSVEIRVSQLDAVAGTAVIDAAFLPFTQRGDHHVRQ